MEPVKSVQKNGAKKKFPERSRRYGSDFKLQIVKKYIEGAFLFRLSDRNAEWALGR